MVEITISISVFCGWFERNGECVFEGCFAVGGEVGLYVVCRGRVGVKVSGALLVARVGHGLPNSIEGFGRVFPFWDFEITPI